MKEIKKMYMTKKLKLDDRKIKEHVSNWLYETKDCEGNIIVKQKKKQSYTPFDVPKKSRLKGLKLFEYKDKDGNLCGKYFVGAYKYNKNSKYYSLGKFIPGAYGVKEACDDWTELNKRHTNDKGHWTSCPLEAKKKAKTIISKKEAIEKRKEPISKVVEDYCKANFPRATWGGSLIANVIRNRAREIAHKIVKGPNLIYSSIKEVLRETENVKEQPAFKTLRSLKTVNKVYRSKDLVEGATSFVKKSKPKWKGK